MKFLGSWIGAGALPPLLSVYVTGIGAENRTLPGMVLALRTLHAVAHKLHGLHNWHAEVTLMHGT